MEFKKEDIVLMEQYIVETLKKEKESKLRLSDIFAEPVNKDGSINNLYSEDTSAGYYKEAVVIANCIETVRKAISEFIIAAEEDKNEQ